MRLRVGTSGYSYKEWKGSFYPSDLPASKMLAFYGARFDTVEINNTFYKLPSEKTLVEWTAQVPAGFTFVLKASQYLSHVKRLQEPAEPIARFWGLRESLGERRGPVLVQLPPFLKKDLGRLEAFLALLPENHQCAIEFRHESWFADDTYEALRKRGVALVASEEAEDPEPPPVVATAPFAYLRLRRCDYDDAALAAWHERIRARGAGWQEVFVFFKHEDEGTGPKLAARFLELA